LAYQRERQRIDRLGWTDVQTRIRPPPNPYRSDYEALVERTKQLLTDHRLVGYHCTRLTATEVESVRTHGLRPLSAEFALQRLQVRLEAGELSRE
jgi:hypothetical protein